MSGEPHLLPCTYQRFTPRKNLLMMICLCLQIHGPRQYPNFSLPLFIFFLSLISSPSLPSPIPSPSSLPLSSIVFDIVKRCGSVEQERMRSFLQLSSPLKRCDKVFLDISSPLLLFYFVIFYIYLVIYIYIYIYTLLIYLFIYDKSGRGCFVAF